MSAGTTITAGTGITATTGNIAASSGNVTASGLMSAGTTITAGTGITATTGNVSALAGSVIANVNITANTGNISATAGSLSAGTTVTAGTGITATTGNIAALAGNVTASALVQGSTLTITTGPSALTGDLTVSGQVGIGTASPSVKLHIEGDNILQNGTSGSSNVEFKINKPDFSPDWVKLAVATAGTPYIWNTSDGDSVLQANKDILIGSSVSAAPNLHCDIFGQVGIKTAPASATFHVNGTSRLEGKVGINTSIFNYDLNLVGDAHITSGTVGINTTPASTIGLRNHMTTTDSTCIYGYMTALRGVGVMGLALDQDRYAGYFSSTGYTTLYSEVTGTGPADYGILARVTNVGSHATSDAIRASNWGNGRAIEANSGTGTAVYVTASGGHGVYAQTSGSGRAIYGQNAGIGFAGYFTGDVHVAGNLSASGTKPFRIDHPLDPENKFLFHTAIESPEIRNTYYGQAVTSDGSIVIDLPRWWSDLNGVNKAEYNYTLTSIGKYSRLFISKEIENNQFEVSTIDSDCTFSWQISAIRHDHNAENCGYQIEKEKTQEEKEEYIKEHG
jgi:hypothetical protein